MGVNFNSQMGESILTDFQLIPNNESMEFRLAFLPDLYLLSFSVKSSLRKWLHSKAKPWYFQLKELCLFNK